ncbi:MAG: YggT family protein [Propionibacterium sp.]|nr:YggT family protein [Propionibacterium sp.]
MAYSLVLMGRMVLSWVTVLNPGWRPRGLVLILAEFIYTITDPPLRALGKIFKPVTIGNIRLDISFLVLVLLLAIAMRVNLAIW